MNPTFQLIDAGWDKVVSEATALGCRELRLVSPFIKSKAAMRLLTGRAPETIRVITRFHPGEMCAGVNDTGALRLLLERGAKIRGVRGLHAKVYLFGDQRAVVTSANLTEAALLRNHEFGFVTSEGHIIKRCQDYFEQLWQRAGPDLDFARLDGWERKIEAVRLAGHAPSTNSGLKDEGASAGLLSAVPVVIAVTDDDTQAFVKFFGQRHHRAVPDMNVLEEVNGSGSHWACTYPTNKRPRGVRDGDVMFMGRLVENPHDIIIYGRAIGLRHVDGRDEATPDEIAVRHWKATWPAYVRVHSAEFVAGTLKNGVSLNSLMSELGSAAFISTQRNAAKRNGNTEPRRSLGQKAHVQLTREAHVWLEERLREVFQVHGKLTPADLETLDWPEVRFQSAPPPERLDEYKRWLVESDGKAIGTANVYARFLTRCAEHYGEVIGAQTIKSNQQAEMLLRRVGEVVARRGRWADGTFNEHDLPDNLAPALRAYLRFNQASSSPNLP